MINIITSFFICRITNSCIGTLPDRNNELVQAFKNNVYSPYIEAIHLFVDDEEALERLQEIMETFDEEHKQKVEIICNGKQALYYDYFRYADNDLQGKICMITNADIYIHSLEEKLIRYLQKTDNAVYALTRHEHDLTHDLIDNYCGSHDSFIFKSPLTPNDYIDKLHFIQNVWGSEAKTLTELYERNIKIYNPCRQIVIVHLHQSGVRDYETRQSIAGHRIDDPATHHPPEILDTDIFN